MQALSNIANRRLKFMVIGAQKAGTTWLHANLSTHPQVSFPPLKELFFFNEIDAGIPTSLLGRKFNNHWLNIKWKNVVKENLPQAIRQKDGPKLLWLLRYLMIPRNLKKSSLDRYDCLFPYVPGNISGDITPNYSLLSEEVVKAIADYYPDCKVIFIMRNPIDRSWSQARMNLGVLKNRSFEDVPSSEVKSYLLYNPSNAQLSDYKTTIGRWSSYFRPEQLHFTFYDALEQDPVAFYRDVLSFLELEDTFDEKRLRKVVYGGVESSLPEDLEFILSQKYQEQIQFLATFFKNLSTNYPAQWLAQTEKVISRHTSSQL